MGGTLARGAALALGVGGEAGLGGILSGGAVRADAGAFDPVRPGGAARGGGDRALFDTQERIGLRASTVDPRGSTEGGLIV